MPFLPKTSADHAEHDTDEHVSGRVSLADDAEDDAGDLVPGIESPEDSFVYSRETSAGRQWYLRAGQGGEGVRVPERIARLIALGIAAEDERRFGDQAMKVHQVLKNVNCHKAVLYMLKKISKEQLLSDPEETTDAGTGDAYSFEKEARALSDRPFEQMDELADLEAMLAAECAPGEWGVCQALVYDGSMHTFIFGLTPEDRSARSRIRDRIVCAEKVGFGDDEFRVSTLEEIFNYRNKGQDQSPYGSAKWRFIPKRELGFAEDEPQAAAI